MMSMITDGSSSFNHLMASSPKQMSPISQPYDGYHSPVSPPSPGCNSSSNPLPNMMTSSVQNSPSYGSHTRGAPKECGVCGDVAKSMHFGGLSCDSCKAFFRRSVQNHAYRGFSCPYDKKCTIGVSSRKACQYCRFEKCESIGMEKSWVMTEKERRKMMQQRQERKQKIVTEKSTEQESNYALTEEDRSEIALIVSLYQKAYQEIPYEDFKEQDSVREITSNSQAGSVIGPWLTFCGRMAYFFSLFNEFSELSNDDQFLLLQKALTSAGLIMGAVVYDGANGKCAPKQNAQSIPRSESGFSPNVSMGSVHKMLPSELVSSVDSFFRKFQQICVDEKMAMILILISLYSSEIMGLQAKETVQRLQDRYTGVLNNYIKFLFKEKAALIFPKALVSLADVRVLAEKTYQMKINNASLLKDMQTDTPINHGAVNTDVSNLALCKEKMAKRARLAATGDARDRIFQRVWTKVMDQMHITSMKLRAPSLLPFIIPIVKSIIKQDNQKLKQKTTGTRRASHRVGAYKVGHKRRIADMKRQQHLSSLQPLVKQEAPDVDVYEDSLMESNAQMLSSMDISATQPSIVEQGHMNSQNNFGTQQMGFSQEMPSFLSESPHYSNSPPMYPNIPSPLGYISDGNDGGSVYSPASVTESDPSSFQNCLSPPVMGDCGQNSDLSNMNARTSPFLEHQHNYTVPSPESAYSPYSSGSSSSSFEDSGGTFSDIEIDVLTSLIECVTSQDPESSMDMMDDRQVKEVIPLPLLTELQRKLSQS